MERSAPRRSRSAGLFLETPRRSRSGLFRATPPPIQKAAFRKCRPRRANRPAAVRPRNPEKARPVDVARRRNHHKTLRGTPQQLPPRPAAPRRALRRYQCCPRTQKTTPKENPLLLHFSLEEMVRPEGQFPAPGVFVRQRRPPPRTRRNRAARRGAALYPTTVFPTAPRMMSWSPRTSGARARYPTRRSRPGNDSLEKQQYPTSSNARTPVSGPPSCRIVRSSSSSRSRPVAMRYGRWRETRRGKRMRMQVPKTTAILFI